MSASRQGNFFVSDEYGPFIWEFNRNGVIVRRLDIPNDFEIKNPSGGVGSDGTTSLELYPEFNTSGRKANRGMEGLAITPDAATSWA